MNGLSTNAGFNWQGVFQLALGAIIPMPDGHIKNALLVICLICMAVASFATRGSGISPEQAKTVVDAAEGIDLTTGFLKLFSKAKE